MNAAATRRVCRLDDPYVALGLRLAQFLVVRVEVMKLVRQDVRVRNEIVLVPPEALLHLHIVVAKPIFSGDFIALWEVIDSLKFV